MSEYTYKLVNGRTKTVTIKDGKPELYSELEWALWLDINSMEQRHLDDLKCIEELKDKLARSDRKEIEAVYRKLGELEATVKAIRELPDKWRKYSFDNPEAAEYMDSADCADELEALLPEE